MEYCQLNYFILGEELKSSCDFSPNLITGSKGIYEVFRVINGTPLFLKEHIDRFYNSAEKATIDIHFSRSHLLNVLKNLIETNRLKTGNIQFQFSNVKNKNQRFIAWVTPAIYPSKEEFSTGVNISTLNAIRVNPQLKSTNLPARKVANNLIAEQKIFEVLLFDDNELVTEGSRSNIFFVKDNELFTPNQELVLPGITRSKVIEIAFQEKIALHSTHISIDDLNTFEAAFLSSTSMKVLPVISIEDINFSTNNKLVRQIMKSYNKMIKLDLSLFKWQGK